jgi:hypothetical protein
MSRLQKLNIHEDLQPHEVNMINDTYLSYFKINKVG